MRQTTIFLPTEFAQTQVGEGEDDGNGLPDSSERIIGITMRDLQQAAVEGVISNLQASKLWNRLAVSGIPVPTQAQETKFVPSSGYLETAPQLLSPMPRVRKMRTAPLVFAAALVLIPVIVWALWRLS